MFGFASESVINKYFTEFNDEKFSNEDLAFDALGALTGAIFSNYINNNSSIFISHSEENKSTKIMLAHNF